MLPKEEGSPKKYGLVTLFRNSFNVFKVSLYDTVTYQVLFRILLYLLTIPITYIFYDFLFVTKGYPALVNLDIGSFLFSIPGVITVILLAFAAIVIFCIEKFGLLFITASYQTGKRMPYFSAFRQSARHLRTEIPVVVLLLLCYAAVIALFLVPVLVSYASFSDSWFFIPLMIILALLCIVFLYLLYIRWIFVAYLVVLEGKKVLHAFSYKLNRALFKQLAVTVLAWLLLVALCFALIILLFSSLSWLLLDAVIDNSVLLAPFFSLLVVLFSLILFSFSIVANSFDSNFLTELYYQNIEREKAGRDIIVPEPKELSYLWTPEAQKKHILAAISLCLVVVLIGTILLIPTVQKDIDSIDKKIYVSAHRGSSYRAPQNTISAFLAAIEDEADYIELDVQETRDGVVVVLHDANLLHVSGVDRNIWDLNYSELQEIDVGSSFSPEFAGERVPTLEETIDVTKGKIKLNIELKIYGHQKHLEEEVVKLVEEKGIEDQCVITSLDYNALKEVRRLNQDLKIGMIITYLIGEYSKSDVDFYSVEPHLVLTKKFMLDAHADIKDVYIWSLSPREDVSQYVDLGVVNIINNDPVMVRELLTEKQNRSKIEKVITKFFTFVRIPEYSFGMELIYSLVKRSFGVFI
ncbi:MAG: glycerophosphodiester phosphodiesterase family protein [Halobacteriota archaeon]